MKFVLRTLAASLVLFLFGVAHHHSWGEAASALLVCTMLCWITARSQASGAELVVTLAGFYFILVSLTTIPESVLFDVIKVGQAPLVMAPLLVVALGIAIAITLLFQKSKATPGATPIPSANMTIVGLLWRLMAAVVAFMFCYCVHVLLLCRRDVDLPIGQELLPGPEHARTSSDDCHDRAESDVLDRRRVAGGAQDSESQGRAPDSRHGFSRDRRVLPDAPPQRHNAPGCAMGAYNGNDALLRALRFSLRRLVQSAPRETTPSGRFPVMNGLRRSLVGGLTPNPALSS